MQLGETRDLNRYDDFGVVVDQINHGPRAFVAEVGSGGGDIALETDPENGGLDCGAEAPGIVGGTNHRLEMRRPVKQIRLVDSKVS